MKQLSNLYAISCPFHKVDYGLCFGTSILCPCEWPSGGIFQKYKRFKTGMPSISIPFSLVMDFFSSMQNTCANSMLVPTTFRRDSFVISRPLFANDVIIFGQSTPLAARNLRAFLENFAKFSSLTTNLTKNSIFYSNAERHIIDEITTILGLEKGNLPMKYSGMPLSHPQN